MRMFDQVAFQTRDEVQIVDTFLTRWMDEKPSETMRAVIAFGSLPRLRDFLIGHAYSSIGKLGYSRDAKLERISRVTTAMWAAGEFLGIE